MASHELRWKVREGSPWDWTEPDCPVRWEISAPGFETQRGDQLAWRNGWLQVELKPQAAR